jgi:hypothetical protein
MTNQDEIESLQDVVLRVMREKPHTRDCYKMLYIEVLLDQKIAYTSGRGGIYIPYKHYKKLINPNSVGRLFRKWKQEFPELGPTNDQVKEWRQESEASMNDINIWWQPNRIYPHQEQTRLFQVKE